jgi:hypothetical protein
MHDDADDLEPLVGRLHSMGQQPMDHTLGQRVLARAHRSRLIWLHSTKLKVAAALAGGFMIGSVGMASAGALPGRAQDVAHAALSAVGVHVPPGQDRYNGPECDGATTHGQYVKAHPDDPAAATSPCGKPNKAVKHPQPNSTDAPTAPDSSKRQGPPPSAGNGKGKNKEKDKGKDNGDPSTSMSPSPMAPELEPTTTTAAPEPTTTRVDAEPTTSTSTASESTTSTITASTTTSTTTS